MDNILHELVGQKGRPIFLFNNHEFYEDDRPTKKPREVKIYRCSSRRRGCSVKLYKDENGIRTEGTHTCITKSHALENSQLRATIREISATDKNVERITQHLSKEHNFITKKALRCRVERAIPPPCIPHNPVEMRRLLFEAENNATIFRASVSNEEGDEMAFFFATEEMMIVLGNTSRLIINRIENVLSLPIQHEVWILSAETQGEPLATSTYCSMLVYIAHPSVSFRKEVFNGLAELIPGIKTVNSVITNEKILCEEVMGDCFPAATFWISWLSYVVEISDLWAECGLDSAALGALHEYWKLGLSREFAFEEGLKLIEQEIQKNVKNHPNLGQFHLLFKQQWQGRIDKVVSPREALHLEKRPEALSRLIRGSLETCRTIDKLIGAIKKILDTELELQKAFLNGAIKKDKRDRTIPIISTADSTRLANALLQLHNNQITLQTFFTQCLRPKLLKNIEKMVLFEKINEDFADENANNQQINQNVQPGSSGLRARRGEIIEEKPEATIPQDDEPLNLNENPSIEKPDPPLLHQPVDILAEFLNDVPDIQFDLERNMFLYEGMEGITEEFLMNSSVDPFFNETTGDATDQEDTDLLNIYPHY